MLVSLPKVAKSGNIADRLGIGTMLKKKQKAKK